MNEPDSGGPAFPSKFTRSDKNAGEVRMQFTAAGGMTLRDYFAAKAMQSTLESESALETIEAAATDTHMKTAALVARMSYAIADEMLKARQA